MRNILLISTVVLLCVSCTKSSSPCTTTIRTISNCESGVLLGRNFTTCDVEYDNGQPSERVTNPELGKPVACKPTVIVKTQVTPTPVKR